MTSLRGLVLRAALLVPVVDVPRKQVPDPASPPLCLLMTILDPSGKKTQLRIALNHRHATWNLTSARASCQELMSLPTISRVVNMP